MLSLFATMTFSACPTARDDVLCSMFRRIGRALSCGISILVDYVVDAFLCIGVRMIYMIDMIDDIYIRNICSLMFISFLYQLWWCSSLQL